VPALKCEDKSRWAAAVAGAGVAAPASVAADAGKEGRKFKPKTNLKYSYSCIYSIEPITTIIF